MVEIARYRRKQYIVAKKFQMKYIGLILMLVFMTAILCSYVVYYTLMMLMGDKLANVYPQGRLISILNTVNFRLLLSLVFIAPLIIVIGIFASHKIAGPIYRIEKYLDSMAQGQLSEPLVLRKNDELVSLANGVNRVVDGLKAMIKEEKKRIEDALASMERLKMIIEEKSIKSNTINDNVERLDADIRAINKEIEKYKV